MQLHLQQMLKSKVWKFFGVNDNNILVPVKSPIFVEKMNSSCSAEIVLTQKLYVIT
jgi:hypothetical protein